MPKKISPPFDDIIPQCVKYLNRLGISIFFMRVFWQFISPPERRQLEKTKGLALSKHHIEYIIIVFWLFLTIGPIIVFLFPAKGTGLEGPIYLKSRRLEYHIPTQKAIADGEVVMRQEDMVIRADRMECDLITGKGLAFGDVKLDFSKGFSLDTPMAEFNIKTGWWKIHSAHMLLEPSSYISCEEAQQTDPNTIYLKKLSFTTCSAKNPAWQIRGSRGSLKAGRYLKIRHLSFRIKGIPIFYLPIPAYVPLHEAKIKGIQPPELGHSSKHGFFIKNLFTWPISPNTEGHLFLDFFTHTGIALGTGWKYRGAENGQGSEAKFYLLGEKESEKLYGKIDLSLDLGRSDSKRSVIEVHTATKRGFDQRFSSESEKKDAQIEESRVFVSQYSSGFSIIAELEHMRSLDESSKDDVYTLPKLSCRMQPTSINIVQKGISFSPFLSFDLSTAHLNWDSNTRHTDGGYYSIEPKIRIPLSMHPWANITSALSTKQSYMHVPKTETSDWARIYDLDLMLTGPRAFKAYKRRKKIDEQINHLIYPQINYEHKKQDGIQTPLVMDMEEGPGELENISFLLINRIWHTGDKNTKKILPDLDLVISQTLQLKEKRHILKFHALAKPHPIIGLKGQINFDTQGGHRRDIDMDIGLGNIEKGEIDLGWRYLWNDNHCERLNIIRLLFASKPFKGYRLNASFHYNLRSKSRIEEAYTVFYQSICWKGSLCLIRRFDEDLIRVNINLIF